MINLPNGLFIISKNCNISKEDIENLITISKIKHRYITLLTDIEFNQENIDNHMVKLVKTISGGPYDYVFIADELSTAYNHLSSVQSVVNSGAWIGFMCPVSAITIEYAEAKNIHSNIENLGYNCAIIPNVSSQIGNAMMVLFNHINDKNSVITQLDSGNHKVVWSNIFRATGKFDTKITLTNNET